MSNLGRIPDIPQLLVRAGIDAASVQLIAMEAAPEHAPDASPGTRRFAFIALLVSAMVLAVLFGSGVLRQDVISEYVVFVVLGGLAAVLTWGILSSTGELRGKLYGTHAKVTGSLVPFIVIVAGGLLLRTSEQEFAIRIKLVDDAGLPVSLTGSLRLEALGARYIEQVKNTDLVEFTQLPHRLRDQLARVTLDSIGFRTTEPARSYDLHPISFIAVRVQRTPRLSGTVSFAGERLAGGQVLVVGHNCVADIRDGYFEVPCGDLSPPVQVEIRVPEVYADKVCKRTRELPTLTNNAIALTGCTDIKIVSPADGANVDPGFAVDVKVIGDDVRGVDLSIGDDRRWIASPGPYQLATPRALEGDQHVSAVASLGDGSQVSAHLQVHVKPLRCWVPADNVHAAPVSMRKKKCPGACIDSRSPDAKAIPSGTLGACVNVCLCG